MEQEEELDSDLEEADFIEFVEKYEGALMRIEDLESQMVKLTGENQSLSLKNESLKEELQAEKTNTGALLAMVELEIVRESKINSRVYKETGFMSQRSSNSKKSHLEDILSSSKNTEVILGLIKYIGNLQQVLLEERENFKFRLEAESTATVSMAKELRNLRKVMSEPMLHQRDVGNAEETPNGLGWKERIIGSCLGSQRPSLNLGNNRTLCLDQKRMKKSGSNISFGQSGAQRRESALLFKQYIKASRSNKESKEQREPLSKIIIN